LHESSTRPRRGSHVLRHECHRLAAPDQRLHRHELKGQPAPSLQYGAIILRYCLMGWRMAKQATVVFLDDQAPPSPIENRLLEDRGPRALAARPREGAVLISRSPDGAGHALAHGPRSVPDQRLGVAVPDACVHRLRRCVSHRLGLSSLSCCQRMNNKAAGTSRPPTSMPPLGRQTIAAVVRCDDDLGGVPTCAS